MDIQTCGPIPGGLISTHTHLPRLSQQKQGFLLILLWLKKECQPTTRLFQDFGSSRLNMHDLLPKGKG